MSNSTLFVNSITPIAVEGGSYKAGKLSASGLASHSWVTSRISRYMKSKGWDNDKLPSEQETEDPEVHAHYWLLWTDRAIAVLMADYSRELTPEALCGFEDEYLDACFEAVCELNPKLAPLPAPLPVEDGGSSEVTKKKRKRAS